MQSCCFTNLNLSLFLPFSLTSPLSLLKLPFITREDRGRKDISTPEVSISPKKAHGEKNTSTRGKNISPCPPTPFDLPQLLDLFRISIEVRRASTFVHPTKNASPLEKMSSVRDFLRKTLHKQLVRKHLTSSVHQRVRCL